MEDSHNIIRINKINCSAAVADVNNKKTKYIKNCLSIPLTPKLYNNNNITNNSNNNKTPAVKCFAQSAEALGMSSRQSVTNGKAAQPAKSTNGKPLNRQS